MTPSRTMLCITLAVLAMSAAADQTSCRQLLKYGKDIYVYSTALAPPPGSNAGGSGNCSVMLNLSRDKLKVKVYLSGQTQTTGISLKQGSPTGANIITLYSGAAVSPNGLFDGLANNGTIVAADLKGPLAGKSYIAALQAPDDLHKAIAKNSTGSLGIFCVTSTSSSPAALSGQLAKGGKTGKAPPSSTAAAGH